MILIMLDKIISQVLIGLVVLIICIVLWQVFSRYVIHAPSSWSEEFARFLLIWIGMLGAVHCYRSKAHLGINILTDKCPTQVAKWLALFTHLMVIFFAFSVLLVGGCKLVILTLDPVQISPALSVRIAYVYSIVPITGILFIIYGAFECLHLFCSEKKVSGVTNGI